VKPILFFAFVGWELLSFTSEEFKNPKRVFPLMIALSFVIVVALYLLITVIQFTFQLVLPRSHPGLTGAPIDSTLGSVFGFASGKIFSFKCLISRMGWRMNKTVIWQVNENNRRMNK
jgi:amino acid efflux transporter